jgi:hypothetical protein
MNRAMMRRRRRRKRKRKRKRKRMTTKAKMMTMSSSHVRVLGGAGESICYDEIRVIKLIDHNTSISS